MEPSRAREGCQLNPLLLNPKSESRWGCAQEAEARLFAPLYAANLHARAQTWLGNTDRITNSGSLSFGRNPSPDPLALKGNRFG